LQSNLFLMLLQKCAIFILAGATICLQSFAQKYNFISYNIKEGLPQSQVLALAQSEDRQLWMSTFAGITKFDGKTFYTYTTFEGLANEYVIDFAVDYKLRTWAITNSGLNLIEGNKISIYPLPATIVESKAMLAITKDNTLWCLINGILYSFKKGVFVKAEIPGLVTQSFLSLIKGEKKNTYLMTPDRSLYKYMSNSWQLFTKLSFADSFTKISSVYIDSTSNIWILTPGELFVQRPWDKRIESWFKLQDKHAATSCFAKDKSGNLWVGVTNGAYKIRKDKSFVHFDYSNGFSNHWVRAILNDVEGNVWLATDGDGLHRYSGGIFTCFDNEGDPSISNIGSVANDNQGNILFGNTGNDFCFYTEGKKKFPFKNTALQYYKINCVFADTQNVVWVGTHEHGLWKYENGEVKPTSFGKITISGINEDDGRILFSTDEGVIIYENGKLKRKKGYREPGSGAIFVGKDSLWVCPRYGLALLNDTGKLYYPFPANLQKARVESLIKKGDKIFINTIGAGIFIWNKATGIFRQLTTAEGLCSNIIYSLKFDNKEQLWAGTGKGVCRLVSKDGFNTITIHNYGMEQGFKGLECNTYSIGTRQDNTVWVGTAKGLYCYHPEEDLQNFTAPKLILQSVKLFSKPLLPQKELDNMGDSILVSIPENLVLPSKKNNITFEFLAISYSLSSIRYSYFLDGLESDFSLPDFSNSVVYPSLPPGNYVFNVRAMDEAGNQLGDVVKYPFLITPAFYQMLWFKSLWPLAALGIAFLVYSIRKNNLNKQKVMIEKLRSEDQKKIRQNTARDFHDEMGNKLARITVLSDILKTKLPVNDEAQGLAKKIQENVGLLYQGTKDIIWSLNPENDNLHFLLKRISDFGVDLFIDTDIEFEAITVNEAFRNYFLPMDYARNIIMIYKEVLANILKHSHCTKVKTEAVLVKVNMIRLTITDDGKGFNADNSTNGNGVLNIRQRAINIGAGLVIHSGDGKGTSVVLSFTVPPALPAGNGFKK
jgi:signal transduction histidine kinase/ligand-binding sensor domain-containing protein